MSHSAILQTLFIESIRTIVTVWLNYDSSLWLITLNYAYVGESRETGSNPSYFSTQQRCQLIDSSVEQIKHEHALSSLRLKVAAALTRTLNLQIMLTCAQWLNSIAMTWCIEGAYPRQRWERKDWRQLPPVQPRSVASTPNQNHSPAGGGTALP